MLSEAELQKKYGIGQADWQRMFQAQGGKCAICRCQQRYQSLAVDHCHRTKTVRGLLCVQCNRGLGRFFDSPIRLRRAAEYIEASRLEKPRENADPSTARQASPDLVAPPKVKETMVEI